MALSGSFYTNDYSGRYYTLSWTATQSIANNTSTVSWTLSCAGGSSWYAERTLSVYLAGLKLVDKVDRVERYAGTISSGSFTVTHNSSGDFSMSGSIQAAVYGSSINCTGSGSWSLDTIPRYATITSAEDFTDEGNPTIYYSNPAGSSVTTLQACISFTGSIDDISYRDIPKDGYYYTFMLTEAERDILRNGCATSNSRTVWFYVKSVIGGVTQYKYLGKTLTIVNAQPSLGSSVYDSNSTTTALTGNSSRFIKGYSNGTYSVNPNLYKGAWAAATKVTCGSQSSTAATGTLYGVDSGDFTFGVTDSRNNYATVTLSKTLIDYVPLTCNLNLPAPTTDGKLTFTISGNYWNGNFGAKANTLQVWYRYKTNSGSYGSWIDVSSKTSINTSGGTYTTTVSLTGLTYTNSYTFQVWVDDELTIINSLEKKVKTTPVFDWGEEDFAFNVPIAVHSTAGISCDGGLAVAGDTNFYSNVTVSHDLWAGNTLTTGGSIDCNGELDVASSAHVHGALGVANHIAIGGQIMQDFVVSQGTASMGSNGTWYWTKWASGKAECYGTRNYGNMSVQEAWGSMYCSAIFTQSFPSSLFNAAPKCCDIQITWGTATAWVCSGGEKLSATVSPEFYIVRPTSAIIGQVWLSFHAIGTWK